MGYIIEPKGIDLVVAPSELTADAAKAFSAAIAFYKKTGKAPVVQAVNGKQESGDSNKKVAAIK